MLKIVSFCLYLLWTLPSALQRATVWVYGWFEVSFPAPLFGSAWLRSAGAPFLSKGHVPPGLNRHRGQAASPARNTLRGSTALWQLCLDGSLLPGTQHAQNDALSSPASPLYPRPISTVHLAAGSWETPASPLDDITCPVHLLPPCPFFIPTVATPEEFSPRLSPPTTKGSFSLKKKEDFIYF